MALELVVIKCVNQKGELKEVFIPARMNIRSDGDSGSKPGMTEEKVRITRSTSLEQTSQNDKVGDKIAENIKSQIESKNLVNKPVEEKVNLPVSDSIEQSNNEEVKPVVSKTKLPEDIWSRLCKQVSENNPAFSALMKNTLVKVKSNKLIVQTSSKFLYDMISKNSNLNLISGCLQQLGYKDVDIECELSNETDKTVNQVAEVFDII